MYRGQPTVQHAQTAKALFVLVKAAPSPGVLVENKFDTSTYSLDSSIAVLLRADVKHQGEMQGRQQHCKSSGCG